MHACAEAGSAELTSAGDEKARGAPAEATKTVTGPRGNEEWGLEGGCAGLVQAYNHVIRVCGDAGGTELALGLLQDMHQR